MEVIAPPSGSKSRGETQEPLKCVPDYGVIRDCISGSVLLQSLFCKVNSTGDNTEPSGLFSGDRSGSDTAEIL